MSSLIKPYTHEYKAFRGVDFSTRADEVLPYRSPDALNMWKNYRNKNQNGSIETRPDLEFVTEYNDTIYGLYFYEINKVKHRIIHSGTKLYDEDNIIYQNMAEARSVFFVFNNVLYIKDGVKYLQYNGTGEATEVVGYIPTTTISKAPTGGGTIYEDVNLLSDFRKNSFVADSLTEYVKTTDTAIVQGKTYYIEKTDESDNKYYKAVDNPVVADINKYYELVPSSKNSKEYYLDAQYIDNTYVPRVWVNDEEKEVTTDFTVDYEKGLITFVNPVPFPLTDGRDNVIIEFKKTKDKDGNLLKNREKIEKCTMATMFDTRVFFSGNPDKPNMLWHCSLNDPSYCSDLDYYTEGVDDASIKSLIAGNNALWVLKEPNNNDTTIFYHNPVIDENYGKIYAPTHSSISTGCVGAGINFNDDICFFSDRGMEAISGDVTTEQVIGHRSSLIDNKLLNLDGYKDMLLEEWEGYLLVIINNKVFLADSRAKAEINTDVQYEWFYWEFKENITATRVKDGVLYLCSDKKIYTLTKTNAKINSYWCTMADEFNAPQYQKTTNKRGCVADVEGTKINVYAKTDNNKFEKINTYKNVKGYIVPRIKKKKWKSIQVKFESDQPFNLYSCTLEAYVGSYIKR